MQSVAHLTADPGVSSSNPSLAALLFVEIDHGYSPPSANSKKTVFSYWGNVHNCWLIS